jgi:hypothetical protein
LLAIRAAPLEIDREHRGRGRWFASLHERLSRLDLTAPPVTPPNRRAYDSASVRPAHG